MHYRLVVAIPGITEPEDVDSALLESVVYFAEPRNTEDYYVEPGSGMWDYFVVGGRWSGAFILTREALARRCSGMLRIPIPGFLADLPERAQALTPFQTDCARLQDIDPWSLSIPHYWIGLDGSLHEWKKFDGRCGDTGDDRFRQWIASIPADTWLINMDVHR